MKDKNNWLYVFCLIPLILFIFSFVGISEYPSERERAMISLMAFLCIILTALSVIAVNQTIKNERKISKVLHYFIEKIERDGPISEEGLTNFYYLIHYTDKDILDIVLGRLQKDERVQTTYSLK